MNLEHSIIPTNGIELHTVQAGPLGGKVVILLHGFPEFWYGWKRQIEGLAEAGFRVIAPDQRGYNLSSKPAKIADYDIDLLAKDIVGLIDSLGQQKVYLVGHDWGGAVAWWMALKYPDRLEKLAILNCPHPVVIFNAFKSSWKQLFKSWYIFFFQLPLLPEWITGLGNFAFMAKSFQQSSRALTFSNEDIEKYREAWKKPRAWHSMINWYRAAARKSMKAVEGIRISVPTLIIWGEKDAFLGCELATQSAKRCDNARVTLVPGASHWVQHEEPEQINSLLKEFFS